MARQKGETVDKGQAVLEVASVDEKPQIPDGENFRFKTKMENRGKTVQLVIKFDMKDDEMADVFVNNYGEFIVELIGSCFARSIMNAVKPSENASFYG